MKKCGYIEDAKEKCKIPLTGSLQREEFSKTLSQALNELKEEIRGMKNERQEDILRFAHEGGPTSSYDGCENSATSSDLQRSINHFFMKKRKKEGDVPKRETLGDYLQEYEAQSKE